MAINKEWGSFEQFQTTFAAATVAVQGSGWGWLGYNSATKRLEIMTKPNQVRHYCYSYFSYFLY
jgi:Fe-Mn family superoxide dismutase